MRPRIDNDITPARTTQSHAGNEISPVTTTQPRVGDDLSPVPRTQPYAGNDISSLRMSRPPHDKNIHPLATTLTGLLLIAACLVARTTERNGLILLAVALIEALCFSRPPAKQAVRFVLFALMVYAPMLLLLPASSVVQGCTVTIVSLVTLGMLGYATLHEAILHLPVPGRVKLLLLQILHQLGVLSLETAKIQKAMVVRGALTRGPSAWPLLRALPRVWLPRVVFKANRVAHALELRDYGALIPPPRWYPWTVFDIVTVVGGAATLAAGIAARWAT